jgi:predicted alpha/beta-fold hydrolase
MSSPAYQAPLWLRGSHAQTLWPLAIKGGMPEVVRERWELPDGDFIDVDRLPVRAGKPLVLMFHGLEGSSRSHYTRALLRTLEARGWNGAVPHFRGCSGEPNRKLRAYHSGDAAEIDWILRRFAERYPDVPRYASGVSLGGNALLVWLGQQGERAKSVLSAAAAISAPLDLAACGHHLARGFNQIYSLNFLATMKRNALAKLERFPGSYDGRRVKAARRLYEFDEIVTAPLHGFANAEDYWTRASAKPWLDRIALPTLLLNARNDPFMPAGVLPTAREVSPSVTLEQPGEGGHVGFVEGPFPGNLDWLPQRLIDFFEQGH